MSLISKIINWVQLLFKRIPKELRNKAVDAKNIVDVIIKAINHPGVKIITELTATQIDNQVLMVADKCLRQVSSWLGGEEIDDIAEILRNRSEKDRNGTLLKIGSDILSCLDDNKLKENQYDLAIQSVVSASKLS